MRRSIGVVLCTLLACLAGVALAEQIIVDGVVYELENGVAYVQRYVKGADEVVLHADIRGFPVSFERREEGYIDTPRLVLAEGIVEISNEWFWASTAETLVLPSTLREIGASALTSMDNLRELVIPEGVEQIGNGACSGGQQRTVTLPSTVVSIGVYAFWGCPNLEAFIVHPDNPSYTAIDGVLYSKDGKTLLNFPAAHGASWTVPDETTTIETTAFGPNERLRSLTLGAGVASIDENTFSNFPNLEAFFVHPDNPSCTAIDGVLFSKDRKTLLYFPPAHGVSWTVPDGTMAIAGTAFGYNDRLQSLTLGKGIASIDEFTFSSCAALEELTLSETVSAIAEYSLPLWTLKRLTVAEGSPYFRNENNMVIQIESGTLIFHPRGEDKVVTVPKGTKRIATSVFADDRELVSVSLPIGLEEIGDSAFSNASALTSISLPVTLLRIGDYAFYGCISLERAALPPGLQSIGDVAFMSCGSLQSIYIPASVGEIGEAAFGDNPQMTITVARGSGFAALAQTGKPPVDPLGVPYPYNFWTFYGDELPPPAVIVRNPNADDLLELFDTPSATSGLIASYPNGTTALLLSDEGEWLYVRIGYTYGYLRADRVARTDGLYPLFTPLEAELIGPTAVMAMPFALDEAKENLETGVRLSILATRGTWYYAAPIYDNGLSEPSFIQTNQVRITLYEDGGTGGQYAIVNNPNPRDRLHLREKPSRDSQSLGRFFNGTQLEVLSEQKGWVRVRVDGLEGHMMAEFVQRVN